MSVPMSTGIANSRRFGSPTLAATETFFHLDWAVVTTVSITNKSAKETKSLSDFRWEEPPAP